MNLAGWACRPHTEGFPVEETVSVRYVQALELGFKVWWKGWNAEYGAYMIYVFHDLSMLRLFEAFLESAPQLALVIHVMICTNKAEIYQYISVAASFLSIAWTVLDYHQSLRSFLPHKDKMNICSKASISYFIWNLLLICPRIASLVLFTSVFNYFIGLHFIVICATMFLWVNLQNTTFMGNPCLEKFYQAVVSVVWYFCWFNVAEGRTLFRSLVYHAFLLVDSAILLTFWFLYMDPEYTDPYWLPVLVSVGSSYTAGLIMKCVYYKWLHPKKTSRIEVQVAQDEVDVEEDSGSAVWFRSVSLESGEQILFNERMHTLSKSFFPLPSMKHTAVSKPHTLLSDKNLVT
ncbi:XK-related protein 8 [Protopterus annectens]|uniref:XK-related protein 8 n=1 Tax=Protopterus annectens TaxID=7888 RepID=UPI001CFA7C05|nr:XK-related protein 8 [Protopterus annectens]